jgi:hypothetical protein
VSEAAEGHGTREIARELETIPTTGGLWRIRYAHEGLDGLEVAAVRHPPIYGEVTDQRIRKVLDQPPPSRGRWATSMRSTLRRPADRSRPWRKQGATSVGA